MFNDFVEICFNSSGLLIDWWLFFWNYVYYF